MQQDKPILAIETSEKICGAAIYFSKDKYFQFSINFKNIHSEKLFQVIDSLCVSAGVKITDFEYIAVSNGPGSFTGLRIGLSAVKGLAIGAGLPILPVPTFEALALQISRFVADETSYFIANKVNTDEVYLQGFKKSGGGVSEVLPLKIVKKEEIENYAGKELIFGNVNFTGNIHNISAPDALYVAEWARTAGKGKELADFDFFEPDYIKEFLIKGAKNV
jgi:tRNA threonylcarbamoyladenosine biosynthesis protein TsaB